MTEDPGTNSAIRVDHEGEITALVPDGKHGRRHPPSLIELLHLSRRTRRLSKSDKWSRLIGSVVSGLNSPHSTHPHPLVFIFKASSKSTQTSPNTSGVPFSDVCGNYVKKS